MWSGSSGSTAAAACWLAVLLAQDATEPPRLLVGVPIEERVHADDPTIDSPALKARSLDAPIRGRSFTLRVEQAGSFTISVQSATLDTYLVLRDAAGAVLAEDDNGLTGTDSRIVWPDADATSLYHVDIGSLNGAIGVFRVILASGAPPPPSSPEGLRQRIDESRQILQLYEAECGPEHTDVASCVSSLAELVKKQGDYEEARTLHARALAIREKLLGPEDPLTARSLHNLASTLQAMGRLADAHPLFERALALREKMRGPDHPDTAIALTGLGLLLAEEGDVTAARPLLERALAIRERALGPEHIDTARSLNNLALLLVTVGDYQEARRLYERSLAIREKVSGPDHPDTATALNNLARVLEHLGDYAEAEAKCRRAVAIGEQALGPDHPSTASSLVSLAGILESQGRYSEALPLYERGLAIKEKALGPDHPETGRTLNDLAGLLELCGSYGRARELRQRSVTLFEKTRGPDHLDTATSLGQLATQLMRHGNFAEARAAFERELAIKERVLGPENPVTASCLNNLAQLLTAMGAGAEALPLFERTLATFEKTLGPDHATTARAVDGLAATLQTLGRSTDEVIALRRRALSIREKALGPEHVETAASMNNLAQVLIAQGNSDEAQSLLDRSLVIHERVLGPDHPECAMILTNLAQLQRDHGETAQARSLLERALAIREAALGPLHPETARTLASLALLDLDAGAPANAQAMARRAVECMRGAARNIVAAATDWEQVAWWGEQAWLLDTFLSVAARAGGADGLRDVRGDAYSEVLAWKGRAGSSRLETAERLRSQVDAKSAACLDDLRGTQSALAAEFLRRDVVDREAWQKRLAVLRDRRSELERGLGRSLADAGLTHDCTSDEIRRALQPGMAFVDFLVHGSYEPSRATGHWGEPRLSAWITRAGSGSTTWIDLGPANLIEAKVTAFLEAFVPNRGARAVEQGAELSFEAAGGALRAALFDPLAPGLAGTTRLFVAPDRSLWTLPLETLPLGAGRFLVEKMAIVDVVDGSSLVASMAPPPPGDPHAVLAADARSLLVLGDVDYDALPVRSAEGAALAGAASATPNSVSMVDLTRGAIGRFEPLPHTQQEIRRIVDLWDAAQQRGNDASSAATAVATTTATEALVLRGADATEGELKRLLSGRSFLHFATHGFFDPKGLPSMWEEVERKGRVEVAMPDELRRVTGLLPGLLSGLVCAGANRPRAPTETDDGFLTAEEIGWLDLSGCELVALSACQTGLGNQRGGGEGLASVARAFQFAGTKSVVASLWNVGDESAADLMTRFYDHLWLGGETKSDALRNAQLAILKEMRIAHDGDARPWTWGAFVLNGGWR